MPGPERGLYETLITKALESRLDKLGQSHEVRRGPLHHAEASDRIALHLCRIVHWALSSVSLPRSCEDPAECRAAPRHCLGWASQ